MRIDDLTEEAFEILDLARETSRPGLPGWGVAFSGGKDSTVMMDLFTRWLQEREIHYRGHYLVGDTGQLFQETLDYVREMEQYWGVQFVPMQPIPPDVRYVESRGVQYCCHMLKTVPLRETSKRLGVSCLIVGIRADESPEGANQRIKLASFPDGQGEWEQLRVKPIISFTEDDIWSYIHNFDVPYNELYDERGPNGESYRSLGCEVCTQMISPDADERAGRSINQEEGALEFEREFGYFRA